MLNNSTAKLITIYNRDAQGKPTTARARPEYVVMIDPREMTTELEPYRHVPAYVDDCWAGQETVYLKFNTEAECRAKMKRHLAGAFDSSGRD